MQNARERRRRLLLAGVLGGGAPVTFAAYDTSLAWALSYKFNESSGTTVTNYGSLGSGNGTWTPGSGPPAGALGQAGQRGAGEAYSFNGLESIVTGPTSTTINNATAMTHAFLLNLATAGEAGQARLFTDNGQNRGAYFATAISPFRFNWQLFTSATAMISTTASGVGITASTWMTVFLTYDDAGDRKGRIYLGTASGLAEATYATQTASTGTLNNGSGAHIIGNRAAADRTLDGLVDEYRFKDSVLSLAQMTEWNRLAFL